jgi:hypothetical protein
MPPGEIKNYLIGNISGLSILFSTVRAFFKRYAGWLTGGKGLERCPGTFHKEARRPGNGLFHF